MIRSKEDFFNYCARRIPGFTAFTDIQDKAFGSEDFWNSDRSVFITATTAAGKSLVAYGAMLQARRSRPLKSIYVVPFRSLAMQKYEEIQEFFTPTFEEEGDTPRVLLSTSEYSTDDDRISIGDVDVVVTIYEKLLLFINHCDNFLSMYDVVVMDEFGIVSDADRGLKVDFTFMHCLRHPSIRLVALSTPFYCWDEYLRCGDFLRLHSDARPHKLIPHHCFEKPWASYVTEQDRNMLPWLPPECVKTREHLIAYVCAAEYERGNSVLVFCHSRNRTRSLVNQIYKFFLENGVLDPLERMSVERDFEQIYEDLGISHGDLFGLFEDDEETKHEMICNVKAAFLDGITFHNAALPYALRSEIEKRLFKTEEMSIVVATDTLAYGINSSVSTVIIDCRQNTDEAMFTQYEYLNYCGRAGRHEDGTVYTLYRDKAECLQMQEILDGEYQHLTSSLLTDSADNDRPFYLLTMLGKGAHTLEELCEEIKAFPNGVTGDGESVTKFVTDAVEWLLRCGLATHGDAFDFEEDMIRATELGRAVCGYVVRTSEFETLCKFVKEYDDEAPFRIFDYFNLLASLSSLRNSAYFRIEDGAVAAHVLGGVYSLCASPATSETLSAEIKANTRITTKDGKPFGMLKNEEELSYTINGLRQALVLTRAMLGDEVEDIYRAGLVTIATINGMMSKYGYFTNLLECLAKYYRKPKLEAMMFAVSAGLSIGGVPYRLIHALPRELARALNAGDSDRLKLMYRTLLLMNRQKKSAAQQKRINVAKAIFADSSPRIRRIWELLLQANAEAPLT